jgi:hypothetical protein
MRNAGLNWDSYKIILKGGDKMAKNPPVGDGHRHGAVKDRSQVYNPKTDHWTKRGLDGKFMDQKADDEPFKGVRKEK